MCLQLVFEVTNFDELQIYRGNTSGLASGNTMSEAKLQGLIEIMERDAVFSMFYSPERCFSLKTDNPKINTILKAYEDKGLAVQFLDVTTEFGVPVYIAFVKIGDQIISGKGAHLLGQIALVRALCELATMVWAEEDDDSSLELPSSEVDSDRIERFEQLPNYSSGDIDIDLKNLQDLLIANGYTPIYADLTRKDLDFPVIRAIVPGLDATFNGIGPRQLMHLIREIEMP